MSCACTRIDGVLQPHNCPIAESLCQRPPSFTVLPVIYNGSEPWAAHSPNTLQYDFEHRHRHLSAQEKMCIVYVYECNCGHDDVSVPPCGEEKKCRTRLREAGNPGRGVITVKTCGRPRVIEERVHRVCERCDPEYREGRTTRYVRLMETVEDEIEDRFSHFDIPDDLEDDIIWMMTRGRLDTLREHVTSRSWDNEQVLRVLAGDI